MPGRAAPGGETGVVSVNALSGDAVWQAMDDGAWDPALFEACLCRSFSLKPADESRRHTYPRRNELPELVERPPVAYQIEYADGLRGTMLLLPGLVQDITAAARLRNHQEPLSLLFYLGSGHHMQPNFFNPMCHHIENLVVDGRVPYPIERTLLTTGLSIAGVQSLWQEKKLDTPHLDISYQVRDASTFRRA